MSDEQPTLPERMRLAADTIDEANTRVEAPTNGYWRPSELRQEADEVDAEDREAEALKDQVEALARDLGVTANPGVDFDNLHTDEQRRCRIYANRLIESGWRKDGAA